MLIREPPAPPPPRLTSCIPCPARGPSLTGDVAPPLEVYFAERSDEFSRAVLTLANDAACLEAVRALEAEQLDVLVLKGFSIATWLYSGGVERPYTDTDLLVPPNQWDAAVRVLRGLGYRAPRENASSVERSTTEMDLVGTTGVRIDLHHRLAGAAEEPPERCARELLRR